MARPVTATGGHLLDLLVTEHGGLNCDLFGAGDTAIHRNQLTFTEIMAMVVQNLKSLRGVAAA
jgi:hypothetical protein